ncbi:MAG: anaerobic ribonucleoside triphosphate reductase [Clostridiales bacterium]|nr:anaerobic ribonucleoside triphosphate reductase [Clostridiales bacterium]
MFTVILKRDGRAVPYDKNKIEHVVYKAMEACSRGNHEESARIADIVEQRLIEQFADRTPGVEDIQDTVENVLMDSGYAYVARKYILYRAERTRVRELNTHLMKIYDELTFADARNSDMKRDNANIDGDNPMGVMLKYGTEGAKDYYLKSLLTPEQAKAYSEGDIHIHDFDFYALTTTCCQIDLLKLFHGGFSTGHGFLREPNDIQSYAALACITIQANQNDQHGGQSIPTFDYCMAEGVRKTYRKLYARNFAKAVRLLAPDYPASSDDIYESIKKIWTEKEQSPSLDGNSAYDELEAGLFDFDAELYEKIRLFAREYAATETDRATYQAMEALIHNLNTMHSRAGAQVPFSSLNYGTDTSSEGRMVMRNLLLATQAGLGNGETPIYPIQIFKVKDGVSANPGDPNYDLFRLAMKTSAKRLFPNFSFIDAPFNLQYYKPGHPETEVAYMGCRTRVIGNVYDPSREIVTGRGNLSFTSINLPRIAIKANHNIEWFFEELERKMELCCKQLLDRFKIQCSKKVRNFRFLMGQGVWIDSDKLGLDDSVAEVLKHGTLSVGFIGLAETLVALTGHHHGESEEAQRLGIDIVSFMRDFMDRKAQEYKLNFSLLATPAEGLSGRFVRMDKKKFGIIPGVTDREYYTNSFHVPVYYPISAYEKIHLEAPYHALTNAGHITYVELDGAAANNIEAFERVIRTMYNEGIGYGSVNHPVDRDPVCGYNGIIGDECPNCGRHEGDGDPNFERIRRITGYLVGTLENFNDAKRAEERDRVKHNA